MRRCADVSSFDLFTFRLLCTDDFMDSELMEEIVFLAKVRGEDYLLRLDANSSNF